MKKADMRGIKHWVWDHPVIGRLWAITVLVSIPFLFVASVAYAGCKEVGDEFISAAKQMIGIAFFPWGERK